jgi:PKD repeat protein
MKPIKQLKKSIIFVLALSLGMSFCTFTQAETELKVLINEGFEDYDSSIDGWNPDGWNNSGWLYDLYGSAHSGSHWAYSWAAGDTFTLPSLTFGNDTEMSFWYAVEDAGNPMSLLISIDDVEIWNSTITNTDYQKATLNLSSYNGEHTIKIIGNTSGTYGQMLDDILITTYVESTPDNTGDDDDTNGGGGGGGGGLPPPTNNNPTADASNGEPYVGLINESITFDGSASTDDDGSIVNWTWDFGDGNTAYGENVTHSYTKAETYTVLLTVTDDDGATDTYLTSAVISAKNHAPLTIVIKGPTSIQKDENASFNISTTDPDGDPICYVINWDDGTYTNTTCDVNNTNYTASHRWDTEGIYKITCYAKDDSDAMSNSLSYMVFVNVSIEKIKGDITGYLIDYNNDGKYTGFYNSTTDKESLVLYDDNLGYLIDVNDDGTWDYSYTSDGGLKSYVEPDENNNSTNDNTSTPGFELLILLIAVVILITKRRYLK